MTGNPTSKILRRLLSEWFVSVVILLCGALWLSSSLLFLTANNYLYDRLLPLYSRTADSQITLITIDERSLKELGQWPWNRKIHAQMFNQLQAQSPKGILFDVILTEPSPIPSDDHALALAMRRLPQLVLPILMVDNTQGKLDAVLPAPLFASSARLGEIAILPDKDGVVRSAQLEQYDSQNQRWPLLTTLLLDDSPSTQATAATQGARDSSATDLTALPRLTIPFNIEQGTYPSFSYVDLLQGRIPSGLLKDKYVLIGATSNGLGDQYPTPISSYNSTMPGIEIHANILDALIHHQGIRTLNSPLERALATGIPIVLLFVLLLFSRERYHFYGFIFFTLIYVLVVSCSLWFARLWLEPATSLFFIACTYFYWSWRRLSLLLEHVSLELNDLRTRTGHLFQFLPNNNPTSQLFRPHSLELNLERVHQLGYFVTNSLMQLPITLFLIDNSGKILMHNQKAQAQFGQNIDDLNLMDILKQFNPPLMSLHKEHESQWLRLQHREFVNAAGQVFEIHVIHIDMPQAGQWRLPNHGQLWQICLVDLSNERMAQQQRNDLMTYMSHDLRSPQVGILALLQMFKANNSALTPSELVEKVSEKVHLTLNSANALLTLSRAQDKAYYAMEDANLVTLIHAAVQQVWAQSAAKNIKLLPCTTMDGLFNELWLTTDGDLLVRALVNILSNAIRYSPEHSTIRITADFADGFVTCTIQDEGIGISAEALSQLNQLNRRHTSGKQDSPDAAGSFGIGLRMVAAVVEQHGGMLSFESTENQGTKVMIKLPAAPSDAGDDDHLDM